jgi:hypothetical protein
MRVHVGVEASCVRACVREASSVLVRVGVGVEGMRLSVLGEDEDT